MCLLGNSLGYKTIIVMNDNQTQEKKDMLRNIGADLRLVPPKPYKNDDNFVKVAGRLADELRPSNNNGVVWANQFDNVANAKGHYEGLLDLKFGIKLKVKLMVLYVLLERVEQFQG